MREAVAYLRRYMDTYHKQHGYEDYRDETFIDDVLYGLGVALQPEKFKYADGFRQFKDVLREHLATRPVPTGPTNRCQGCGCEIAADSSACGECVCEDDCAP